tara:strand:- start:157 stop:633 length:477 start_codon:yes stop_codon:yes gene_type:complete
MEIQGSNSKYLIYPNGKVWSKYKHKFLTPDLTRTGYLQLRIVVDGKQRCYLLHRLLAIHYIPNPKNYPCVNHKDCNRTNNNLENLEWCSKMYNIQSINTTKPFGSVRKRNNTICDSYEVSFKSNGKLYSKSFRTEEEAECYRLIQEMIVRLEQQEQQE